MHINGTYQFVNMGLILYFIIGVDLACAQFSAPEIVNNRIIFENGVTIEYNSKKLLFDNPKDALRKQLPVAYSEYVRLVREWKKLFLIKEEFYFEGAMTEMSIYDYSGQLVFPVITFIGKPYFLEKENRVLLAQISSHTVTDKSFLLTSNGELIAVIKHGEIFDVGVSEDEKKTYGFTQAILKAEIR